MNSLAALLKAASDEARLRILNLLIHRGELCVCDIEAVMAFTQTKVSRHLAYLRRAGVVTTRRKGLWILYSIPPPADDERREMLVFLARALKGNSRAMQDLKVLDRRMAKGCCATPAVIDSTLTAIIPTLYTT